MRISIFDRFSTKQKKKCHRATERSIKIGKEVNEYIIYFQIEIQVTIILLNQFLIFLNEHYKFSNHFEIYPAVKVIRHMNFSEFRNNFMYVCGAPTHSTLPSFLCLHQ